jgi:hypothetical protein
LESVALEWQYAALGRLVRIVFVAEVVYKKGRSEKGADSSECGG